MRSYVPNTLAEREAMLKVIGVDSMDALYKDVPEDLKLHRPLKLEDGKSEMEIRRIFEALTKKNRTDMPIFRGAGAYNHYIPAAVPQLAMRSEFYTAYTPYQAEMSQGMLQSLFEYQTMICMLTGLDVSNASVYDGATAAAEAVNMAADSKRKRKVAYSVALHPDVIATMKTYAHFGEIELVPVATNAQGQTDEAALTAALDGCAGFIAANPNFYGCLERMDKLSVLTHAANALFIAYVNPISLGALKRPADYNADVAVGEGQPLGMPLSYGGPYLGFMAATNKLMRNLPGRIAGQTTDAEGTRAFVLTLQAREQHIRREKASSNICSNQMLCAVISTMYLAFMGKAGLREVAKQNIQKAHYLAEGMSHIKGITLRHKDTPFFNEFVIDTVKDAATVNALLKARGIMGGIRMNRFDKNDKGMLWCATECNSREEIDNVLNVLEEVLA